MAPVANLGHAVPKNKPSMNATSKRPPFLRQLAAAPVLFAATLAHAQQDSAIAPAPAPAPKTPIQQVEIKGAATAYDARRNDTATKIVVSQEEILKNGDTTVGEVLKRLPGITIGGVQGRGGDIRMRGLGSGYTQILLNGEPAPPGFSLDSISPDMIERIEIMRAATAEYSTHAIGGAVTYAKFERPSEIVTEGYDAKGVQTLLRHSDEGSRGHFEAFNVSPRVNWTLGPGDVITSQSFVNINRFRGDNTERVDTLIGFAPRYQATRVQIESDSELLRSDLSWNRRLAEGAKMELKAGVNYNHRETNAPSQQYGDSAGNALLLNRTINSGATDKGITASGKYSTPIFEGHALATGFDGAFSKRNEDRIQRETSPQPGLAVNDDQVFDATVRRLALFAQDEWTIDPRLSMYFGLRWEGIETRSEGLNYAAIDNKSSVWSPLFQTLWKIPGSKADQLRLGLTRTYKAPNVGSLIPRRFSSNNNTATSPDFQGNPKLKPELAWGLDLAFEHYLEGGGLLTASTYARRIEDITRNQVSLINGLWVSQPTNAGIAKTYGIELEAKLPVRTIWKTAPNVDLRANAARNWSRLEAVPGPDNRLDSQTPFSGTVGADWKLDKLPLTLGGSYSFQNGGPVRISLNQYAYSVPKRSLDVYGLWKFDPKNQLRVSVANGLHQQNVSQSSYADATGRLSDTTITPTYLVVRALMEMKF